MDYLNCRPFDRPQIWMRLDLVADDMSLIAVGVRKGVVQKILRFSNDIAFLHMNRGTIAISGVGYLSSLSEDGLRILNPVVRL